MKEDYLDSILVTGANGFIGSSLILELLARRFKVSTLSLNDTHIKNSKVKNYSYDDLRVSNNKKQPSPLKNIDVVIHLAGRAHIVHEKSNDGESEFKKSNVDLTINLAQQAFQQSVKRFIFISSAKVNGEFTTGDQKFFANDPPNPFDFYAKSKFEAEKALIKISKMKKMDIVIIRPPLVYGPGVKANFLTLVSWVNKGLPLPFGSIQNKRSLVYIENLIDLIIKSINHPAAKNQIFLVSDDQDISIKDLSKKISSALGSSGIIFPMPAQILSIIFGLVGKKELANRLIDSFRVDMTKTKQLLNWAPPFTLDQGIMKTIKSYLSRT